jgi:lipopolysaccharide export system permease protein
LLKEITTTLAGLTTILLLIFMSNQFVHYLNRAASGRLPGLAVFQLLMLEIPNLLGLLLPLGFFVAILLAYGRMYADNEMTVLHACGYGPKKLITQTMIMAVVLSAIVLYLMINVAPKVATARTKLIRTSGVQSLIQMIVPQRFKAIEHGKQVIYVQAMARDYTEAENVFFAQRAENKKSWNVLWAKSASLQEDEDTNEHYISLVDGSQYEGVPGQADFRVAKFKQYKARLPHPQVSLKDDIRTSPSEELWPINNKNKQKAAEIQWRLSVPLMVITLTLIAIPLSRVNPRQGKFAKLLPALIIYILYANTMFVARDWIIAGKIPTWIGLWWLHIAAAGLGIGLIYKTYKS